MPDLKMTGALSKRQARVHRFQITFIALFAFLAQTCVGDEVPPQNAGVLSFEMLMNGTDLGGAVQLSEYARPASALPASNNFSGRLSLRADQQSSKLLVLVDESGLVDRDRQGLQSLPAFDFEFVQDSGYLVPLSSGPIKSDHRLWEYILGAGPVWDDPADHGFSRAAIPFAFKERGADCIHNGLMMFLFNDRGETSQVAFQIGSQTCLYFQFELSGLLSAKYLVAEVDGKKEAITAFRNEVSQRMPQRSIRQLVDDYPGVDPTNFGSIEEIAPETMTVYGFVIDDVHYVGGCNTPYGMYPYCDQLALPSYSTAKSLVGGLALMRMEKLYPGTAKALIEDYVPECGDDWAGVTIEHAIDMTTGHYNSPEPHADENSAAASRFFEAEDHATKIDFACNEYPRKSAPGSHWSYQTSSSYLAGTAISSRWKSIRGAGADFYEDLLVEALWKPLNLSQMSYSSRRTRDAIAQPFTGYGLTLQRDDIAKLAVFIGAADGRIDGDEVLDRELFDAIKQRIPDDQGMPAESGKIRYNNGFRTFDISTLFGCAKPTWLTTMSGFGGINIVLMPNDTAYYYFSDGNVHRYLYAVRESHKIRPMCN
jgi:hypothetical protein